MRKWNYATRQYEDYATPHYWHCPIFSYDMEEEINCASCGRKIKYGEGYTSLEIHTSMGMGYNVCGRCHAQEIKKEAGSREDKAAGGRYEMKEEWIDKVHQITDELEERANAKLAIEIQKATEYREGYVQACEDFGREMRHAIGERN